MAVKMKTHHYQLQKTMGRELPGMSRSDGVSSVMTEIKPPQASSPGDDRSIDSELVKQAANGNEAAFALLVNRHLKQIFSVSRRMLGNDSDAEDISQEVFLKLWKNAGSFDSNRAKLSTWLHRITINLCIDRYRARKLVAISEADEPVISGDQERRVQEQQLSARIEEELSSLPDRQRLAIILFHFEGHNMKSVGELLEISVEAVESLLARARRKLKQSLKSELAALLPHEE